MVTERMPRAVSHRDVLQLPPRHWWPATKRPLADVCGCLPALELPHEAQ